jgi:hypothetical protein
MPSLTPFLAFWNDCYTGLAAAGTAPGQAAPDFVERMRRSFFDALGKYIDEFMRSEAFLNAMKQSFDNAMAVKSATNQLLQKNLAAAQIPSLIDHEQLVDMVRGLEDRLFTRLDTLASRIDKLEKAIDGTGEKRARPKTS